MNNRKLILVCLSIFIFLILLNLTINYPMVAQETLSIENSNNYLKVNGNEYTKLYNVNTNKVDKILVEEYIKGVVASEMPSSFEIEALKAQAVAARTFYYSHRTNKCTMSIEGEICNTVHCQVYKPKAQYTEEVWDKIEKAVEQTKDEVLVYNNGLVMYPQFFSTSSGKTENALDVFNYDIPYLKSVDSKGEEVAPKFKTELNLQKVEFINILKSRYRDIVISNLEKDINIQERADSGLVKKIKIGNKVISGIEFRKIFNLNSANFDILFLDSSIQINCNGYGHGVGMSQWGANAMAREGKNYEEILKHYYTDVEIKKVKLEN